MENDLSKCPLIAITTDGWTSRATSSFVNITAHMVDGNFQMKDYVLQTRPLNESHTGENIAKVLQEAAGVWNLHRDNLTIPIVTDNAKNMECAVRLALCVGPHKHVGCFAHTINLACQRDLQV